MSNGRRAVVAAGELTVAEVVAQFYTHAKAYYRRPDQTPTGEAVKFRAALAPAIRLYGRSPAADFGPLAMQAVQGEMVRLGWCRNVVNAQVRRVRMAFRWAVAQQLVPADVLHGLSAVAPLKAGRTAAPERDPVRPVPRAAVEQTLPHLSPTVAAMVRLQLLTGARPGEVCGLTTAGIDRTGGGLWAMTLAEHKNAHRGHGRTIYANATAQAVLLPFLNLADPAAPIFSPAETNAAHCEARRAARVTSASCGNAPGTNRVRRPRRRPGTRYDVAAYRRAITRACDAAFPPPEMLARRRGETRTAHLARLTDAQRAELAQWRAAHRWHPHQLRHTAATEARRAYGVEGAQALLGHRTLAATQIYAERSDELARTVARAIG